MYTLSKRFGLNKTKSSQNSDIIANYRYYQRAQHTYDILHAQRTIAVDIIYLLLFYKREEANHDKYVC